MLRVPSYLLFGLSRRPELKQVGFCVSFPSFLDTSIAMLRSIQKRLSKNSQRCLGTRGSKSCFSLQGRQRVCVNDIHRELDAQEKAAFQEKAAVDKVRVSMQTCTMTSTHTNALSSWITEILHTRTQCNCTHTDTILTCTHYSNILIHTLHRHTHTQYLT